MLLKSSRFRAYLRAFDIRAYLKEYDGDSQDHGGEVSVTCPVCGPEGKVKKLWVLCDDKQNKKAGQWICYYCEERGSDALSLIRWLEECSLFEALEILATYGSEDQKVGDLRAFVQERLFGVSELDTVWDDDALPHMDLPFGTQLVTADTELPAYFAERGITRKRALRYGLGYTTEHGPAKHANRLVVPVVLHGRQVLYCARYMKQKPPVIKPIERDESGVPRRLKKTLYPFGGKPNRVLFNYDRMKKCKRVVLVEDVFSAMAVGREGGATLGTHFSQYQMELLLKTEAEEVVIMWDLDPGAKAGQSGHEKAVKVAHRLSEFWRVRVPKLRDTRDPDEMSAEEREDVIASAPVLNETTAWSAQVRTRLARTA